MTTTSAIPAIPAMIFDRLSSCFCSGVLLARVVDSRSAMWPISVFIPVAVTTTSPRPRVTEVFMYAMLVRSPSGDLVTRHRLGRLGDRQALARQRRLLDLKRRCNGDPAVGRDPVARLHQDHVSGDQLLGVDLDRLAVATDAGDRLHHLREGLDALLGLRLLPQSDDRVEDGQARQDDGRRGVPGHQLVDHGGASSTSCMKSWYWRTNAWQPRFLLRCGQPVRAMGPEPLAASPAPRPCPGSTSSSLATIEASTAYQDRDVGPSLVAMPVSSLGGVIVTHALGMDPWSPALEPWSSLASSSPSMRPSGLRTAFGRASSHVDGARGSGAADLSAGGPALRIALGLRLPRSLALHDDERLLEGPVVAFVVRRPEGLVPAIR